LVLNIEKQKYFLKILNYSAILGNWLMAVMHLMADLSGWMMAGYGDPIDDIMK